MRKSIPIVLSFGFVLFSLWIFLNPTSQHFVNLLDNIAYDLQLRTRILTKTLGLKSDHIAIVNIDDKSLKIEGHWPWPRSLLAQLVSELKAQGAVIIAFDMFFSEKYPNFAEQVLISLEKNHKLTSSLRSLLEQSFPLFDQDALFATQLSPEDTILGYSFYNQPQHSGILPAPFFTLPQEEANELDLITAQGYLSNIPVLAKAAKNAGFLNAFPDDDGILRRSALIMVYQNGIYFSLAFEAVKQYLGIPITLFTPFYGKYKQLEGIQFGQQFIPTDSKGRVLIPYVGQSFTFPYFSATEVIHHQTPKDAFLGKIVFIGSSATGLGDLKAASVQKLFPGIEVQATLANGLLEHNFSFIPPWSRGLNVALIILLGGIAAFLFPYFGPRLLCILILLLPPIFVLIANWIWAKTGLILSPIFPVLLILTVAIFNTLYGYVFESRRREHLKAMFGQYVPKKHIDEMLKSRESNTMRGEDREMTVLFADIRSFTTLSEKMSATELKAMLNAFFTPMTEIIFNHRGTIDKYVGDMIMAFWGAPLKDKNHVKHAISAALEMQKKVKELEPSFKEKNWPEVHIGIGLNSGIMSVGDMGSKFRRNYTVLGDAVNLGSRVEGLTKYYGAKIIVTEQTAEHQKTFVFQQLDRVRVKGKQQGIAIFEPLGLHSALITTLKNELDLHQSALDHYYKQEWDAAKNIFEKLHSDLPDRKLYGLYLERIAYYKQNPPPTEWDGVYTHTAK